MASNKEEQFKEDAKEFGKKVEEFAKDCGDELEKTLEDDIEKKIEEKVPKFVEGLAGVVAILVVIFLLNSFYDRIPFLTSDFEKVLPIMNMSLAVSLLFNFSRIFIHSLAYKRITNIIRNFIFFFVAHEVWTVFPFDVSSNWERIIRILMGLTVAAVAIGTVVELIKLVTGSKDEC